MNTTLSIPVHFLQPVNHHFEPLSDVFRTLMADTNELFFKSNILVEMLNNTIYQDIIITINRSCEELKGTMPMFYEATQQAFINAYEIACNINLFTNPNYTGWIIRLKELEIFHKNIRNSILDVFMKFNEVEFPTVFQYLKLRLGIHEKYMWLLRNYIS